MADDGTPEAVADATASFREDHDDGEGVLETVLTVDADHETWTFDDVPFDSGTFGELVSRGIVTKADGEYRVASRRGVRAGLEGKPVPKRESKSTAGISSPIAFDGRAAAGLIGALALVVAMRTTAFRSVFRGDYVVSPANDPYYYRYWMEELVSRSDGVTDPAVVANLPERAAERRPMSHATNWFVAELLGGDQWATEIVAAWLPVVAAVLLGVVVYWLAIVVTDDVRVGIASVAILALTPVHAVYTGVGFLEHRPHQYFWLGLTLLALAWLAVDLRKRCERSRMAETAIRGHLRSPWTWTSTAVLGIALGVSPHTWGGSILLLAPVAAYFGLKVAIDVRAGLSPARANLPVLVGLGIGGALCTSLHVGLGWHQTFTPLVSLLVVGGAVVVTGFGWVWRRLERPIWELLGLEIVVVGLGLVGLWYVQPAVWMRIQTRIGNLFFRDGVAESTSLFALENAVVFGPLAQFGLGFYLAVLVLCWSSWIAARRYEPGWLLLSVYAVFWLAMATLQGRFAAQLAIPLSILGGLGLVWLLAWLDLATAPEVIRGRAKRGQEDGTSTDRAVVDGGDRSPSIRVPRNPKVFVAVVWILLLICGMSLFFVPTMQSQAAHTETQFDAAMAIDEHATTTDREHPENYVLSWWGDNRMYNYFVSGESDSYVFAENQFGEFRSGDDPDGWYEFFEEHDVGYVVMSDVDGQVPDSSTQERLHSELGSGDDGEKSPSHYQAIYVSDDVTAFAVVPGATIETTGEPGTVVTATTETTVSGETVRYERSEFVDEDGSVEITVPYANEYTVDDQSVDISPAAVEHGETVTLERA
ncbi:MFS transporter [Natrarchaeobius sp. A-rgal3]|uniref:MFS transporter n=1 Tax=Natrarchaeobius versutus TaxID=1679078 RepID=UPI00350F14C0